MIFIPYNVPSSKNSRVNTSKGSFHSPSVRKYLQKLGVKKFSSSKKSVEGYKNKENLFNTAFEGIDLKQYKPLIIGYHPVRDSKRSFDLHNIIHIVADLMQAHDIIEDDNMENFIAVPLKIGGKFYSQDNDNPGLYLDILNGKTISY